MYVLSPSFSLPSSPEARLRLAAGEKSVTAEEKERSSTLTSLLIHVNTNSALHFDSCSVIDRRCKRKHGQEVSELCYG